MAYLRLLFLILVARPLARFLTGADVVGREKLPAKGPAIVVANHNSHIDTLLMLALFSPRALVRVRPAGAADYFLADPVVGWFSRNIIGIVPIVRGHGGKGVDVLAPARQALRRGDILLFYPEGTRGAASDDLGPLKHGVAHLAAAAPEAPVVPVWIQGAGRVLAKGERVPVPLTCCALVGDPVPWRGDKETFMAELKSALEALKAEAPPLRWANRTAP
jgi:1-acyl-sn-glycerol-3-phosphate acyltransferase